VPVQHTGQVVTELILQVYPLANGKAAGWWYDDDGLTTAHEKGKYSLTQFRWDGRKLKSVRKKSGFKGHVKKIRVDVAGRGES
jgi:alpha-glucosidase (family GH31 glycosyl hydrolase)